MKNLICIVAMLCGTAALACTDFTGTYTMSGNQLKMQVTQQACASITFASFDQNGQPEGAAQTYVTDGSSQTSDGSTIALRHEDAALVMYLLNGNQTPDTSVYKATYTLVGKDIHTFNSTKINSDGTTGTTWHDGAVQVWTGQ